MKLKLLTALAVIIPALAWAQSAPPVGMTMNPQNNPAATAMAGTRDSSVSSDSSSDSCDSACQEEAKKAYKYNYDECRKAGGTAYACTYALNGG